MRRAQSTRHYGRPSLALGADDLGMLKENPDESLEDVLRRQLLEKDRENDKLQTLVQTLQAQLAKRPPVETIQALEKEYTNLEILLQGTQRENERCMVELERGKTREKMLERELEKLMGSNWQASLDITPIAARATGLLNSQRGNPTPPPDSATRNAAVSQSTVNVDATMGHLEQVRMLVLGMEQRLQSREDKLRKTIDRAQAEGSRFEEMRHQVLSTS
ncbi:hypothetical protein B0H21DRAFT_720629 [Amylocystis lapponica]|nr:hypothetical protein B0H21DRAFT_720629 [Amylocystis lapponica]